MALLRLNRPHLASVPKAYLSGRRHASSNSRFLQVSEEVRQAVSERRPVVALETTIYTHGFPYPDNLHLASKLESLVRENGAVPATIGILEGIARVGLERDELDRLISTAGSPNLLKISRRDLGFACGLTDASGKRFNGGTTIAGTMILANMAGIRIFGTGGLGGVHRGAETTMDVSADLTELGRTPVCVISSGCKSFLDLPKTLEVLETHGVAVATFLDGRKASSSVGMPGFYTRESGVPSPKVLKDELEAARVLHAHFSLELMSGLHFANPIAEKHSVPREVMDAAISEAIGHARAAGASGAAETPYILNRIKEITGSRSVKANRALVEGNVVRAAKVAMELAELEKGGDAAGYLSNSSVVVGPAAEGFTQGGALRSLNSWAAQQPASPAEALASSSPASAASQSASITQSRPQPQTQTTTDSAAKSKPSVFVAGSLAIDLSCDYTPPTTGRATGGATLKPALSTSNPAQITQSLGGVGANVARAAHLMGADVRLCSAVGHDLGGRTALEALTAAGMDTAGVKTLKGEGKRTAQYVAVNDSGKDLVMAMADMSILEHETSGAEDEGVETALHEDWLPQLREAQPSHLLLDGNWPPHRLHRWLSGAAKLAGGQRSYTIFEPVSTAKAIRPFKFDKSRALTTYPKQMIDLITPNRYELSAMHTTARAQGRFDSGAWWQVIDALGIPSTGARVQMTMATSSQLVDEGIPQQSVQLLPFFPSICTKLGSEGVLLTQIIPAEDPRLRSAEYAPYILSRCANGMEESLRIGGVYMRLFPPAEEVGEEEVVSVNGVGDTFVGTLVAGMAKARAARRAEESWERVEDFVDVAQRAAVMTLKSTESVSPGLGALSGRAALGL